MHEQRRSRRVLATLPLEILANGEVIPATTAVINLNGALIFCSVKWPQGSELKFRNAENGVVVRGSVVWSGDVAPNGLHKLGVEFAAAAPNCGAATTIPTAWKRPKPPLQPKLKPRKKPPKPQANPPKNPRKPRPKPKLPPSARPLPYWFKQTP